MNESINRQLTVVQIVHLDETGDSMYRMKWPAIELSKQVPNWRVLNVDSQSEDRLRYALNADLLVVYQSHDFDLLGIILERRKKGRPTLVEYNDNFYEPPPASPVSSSWRSPLIQQTYRKFIEASDGVIVTGSGLQDLFSSKFDKEITILENHLHELPDLRNRSNSDLAVGWAGSLGHMADLLSIVPVLEDLLREFPKLSIHLMGNESIPRMLPTLASRLKFTQWGGMDEYYRFWDSVDIGIAPLIDTPYNRCRSDIKPLEMASRGVAPVVSSLLPYRKLIDDFNVPTFHNLEELRHVVSDLIKDSERRRVLVDKLSDQYVANRFGPNRTERQVLYSRHLDSVVLGESEQTRFNEPVGYHEVSGVRADKAEWIKRFEEIRGDEEAARNYALLNLHNPDLFLSVARVLKKNQFSIEEISDVARFHPGDFRFNLLRVGSAVNEHDRLLWWDLTISELEAESERFRYFFERDVVRRYSSDLSAFPRLLDYSIRLIALYPESAILKYALAETYSRLGDSQRAIEYFDWLTQRSQRFILDSDFFKEFQAQYSETWSQAHRVRLSRKLS